MRPAPLLLAAALAAALLPSAAGAAEPARLAIEELGSERISVDAAIPGPSAGDRTVFRGPIRLADGTGGTVAGVTTVVRTAGDLAPDGVAVTFLAYDLGGGDTIVLAGTGPAATDGLPPVGTVVTRAVLGGTGRFSGTRGELVSTVGADGTWANELTLHGIGDPVVRTLEVVVPMASAPGAPPPTPIEPGETGTDWFPLTIGGGPAGRGAATLTGVGGALVPDDPMRSLLCLVSLVLGDGDRLFLAGFTPMLAGDPGVRRPTTPLAIIGGTGRFDGARGEDVVTFRPDGSLHALRIVGVGAGSAPAGSAWPGEGLELATVENDPAEIELGGGAGTSLGDLWTWTSRTEIVGKTGGTSVGLLTNVARDADSVHRLGLAFYEDPTGTLVVASLDPYPAPGAPLTVGSVRLRAAVGGTGAYRGAAGAVEIARAGDDRFDYIFTFVRPGA